MEEITSVYRALDKAGLWTRRRTLKRGEYLMLHGHHDRDLYYVESGTLVATAIIGGEEQCMRFGYTGDIVAAIDTHLGGGASTFGIKALRKSELRIASYSDYRAFMQADPERRLAWERSMEWLIQGLLEREIDLLTPGPEERYQRVLARSPRLFQEVPAKYIANYLRMTPETLSRIKKDAG
ncbi:CRP-like cAMP-binding protein [Neolewinella xylanilytica]|uniref:CRP-like cAMP-binding protein n=1 Tax=Neolewinella xylanilytica TaxID=1514080 RepID=A0A2S6I1U0_9BACT|nr:Crp/Fnr family transcriptional regulator [Neolewinella xylanilytica]PPK85142.1 CRP-like cAMP-binding protein [Neolewinella xylanilytica]